MFQASTCLFFNWTSWDFKWIPLVYKFQIENSVKNGGCRRKRCPSESCSVVITQSYSWVVLFILSDLMAKLMSFSNLGFWLVGCILCSPQTALCCVWWLWCWLCDCGSLEWISVDKALVPVRGSHSASYLFGHFPTNPAASARNALAPTLVLRDPCFLWAVLWLTLMINLCQRISGVWRKWNQPATMIGLRMSYSSLSVIELPTAPNVLSCHAG